MRCRGQFQQVAPGVYRRAGVIPETFAWPAARQARSGKSACCTTLEGRVSREGVQIPCRLDRPESQRVQCGGRQSVTDEYPLTGGWRLMFFNVTQSGIASALPCACEPPAAMTFGERTAPAMGDRKGRQLRVGAPSSMRNYAFHRYHPRMVAPEARTGKSRYRR